MPIPGYATTRVDPLVTGRVGIGNAWSSRLFDGTFYRGRPENALPAVSLVFVQSRSGNTVTDNPQTLGGGETDLHLIYEGLSRVDADAVLAGASTARSERMIFSVWHPEMIRLRADLGHPRHPAQVILTDRADLPFERGLMFQVPELSVIVITKTSAVAALRQRLAPRPWVQIIDAGEPVSLTRALRELASRGIHVISAVGGRRTASALLKENLVGDVYLTTSAREAGEENTPFYGDTPPRMLQVIEKAGRGAESGVRFEHRLVSGR